MKRNRRVFCVMAFGVVVTAVAGCGSGSATSGSADSEPTVSPRQVAEAAAKDAVLGRLSNPRDAYFGDIDIATKGNGVFFVGGYVHGENALGGTVRELFIAKVSDSGTVYKVCIGSDDPSFVSLGEEYQEAKGD